MRDRELIERDAGNPDKNGRYLTKFETLLLEVVLDIRHVVLDANGWQIR